MNRAVFFVLFTCLFPISSLAEKTQDPIRLPMGQISNPFKGKILTGDTKPREIYRFNRTFSKKGNALDVLREYTTLDGATAATERVVYNDEKLAQYEVSWLQTGEVATVTIDNGKIQFKFKHKDGKISTDEDDLDPNTLIGEQIGGFLVQNWEDVLAGKTLNIRLIVPQRSETIGFKLSKEREDTKDGKPTVVVKMKPSSVFISLAVPTMYFTFGKDKPYKLYEYKGRTTPFMPTPEGGFKPLDGVTVFE